jgi:hypothetical protein
MHVAPLAIAPPRVAPLLAEGREEEQLHRSSRRLPSHRVAHARV